MTILDDLFPVSTTAEIALETHTRIHQEMQRAAERHMILAAKATEDAAYLPIAQATFEAWQALESAERAAWTAYQAAESANL